ncbi:MAG: hemolysin family protein [Pseudoflavonifractor sp.]|nr:hemolysin family protein [Pseudoflavonifractor sp.]
MSLTIWITIAIISLIFSALFSGTEIAYISSDKVRVELDVKKGGIANRIINLFYSRQNMFITTVLVGNNVMLIIYGMGMSELLDPWLKGIYPNEAFILVMQTLISTGIILFIGEFFPKSIFRINPNTSLKFFALPIFLFYIVLYPISRFTELLSKWLMRLFGIRSDDTGLGMLTVGELNNYIQRSIDETDHNETVENEVKIFHNAIDFSSTYLRDCMIPRNEIVAVDIDETSRDHLCQLFIKSGRSKIIVYREDIDNIVGYIHVSELFHTDCDWHDAIRPVEFAPETLLANKMMRRLLADKRSIAVVVDEFGGTSGLVTLEDLVEEIFGDIQDEHDHRHITAREIEPGVYEFSGRMEIADLNDNYHIPIPEDDEYQTLAGYLLTNLGAMPKQGDTIDLGDITFTIVKASATRIELVRVALPTPDVPDK